MPLNDPHDPSSRSVLEDFAGLDALEVPVAPAPGRARRIWSGMWPQATAAGIALVAWQIAVWTHVRPPYLLPGPVTVLHQLWSDIANLKLVYAAATTIRRALVGYGFALVIGSAIGLLVARNAVVRTAIGSLITGLQTMPTIAWFPLAILLFGLTETAITFVVVLGAAPAVANGLISGIDDIPQLWLRTARVLGARGLQNYRHVVFPAALPGFISGLKQGWAFAWRSLMAGELLVLLGHASLGQLLQNARDNVDAPSLMATMLAILAIGNAVDSLGFSRLERAVRTRWGLTAT